MTNQDIQDLQRGTLTQTVREVAAASPAGTLFDIYDADGCHEAQVRACDVEDALVEWALENLEHADLRLVMVPQGWGARETWYRVERSLDNIRVSECAE